MTESSIANPGVRFPPPLLFVAGLLLGSLFDRFVRPLSLALPPSALTGAAIVAIVLATALVLSGAATFRRARTAIIPHRPASRLVQTGPYRFTRNPMYTGFTIAYLGIAALMDTLWPLLLLPFVLIALVRLVIRREEDYLASAFGAEYAQYRARVRRWL